MKPVSILRLSINTTLVVAAFLVNDLQAQESAGSRSVRRSEQAARANWQPTRSRVRKTRIAVPELDPSDDTRTIQQVQAEGIPSPPPESAISIVTPSDSGSLDGQITLAPVYEGEIIGEHFSGDCGCDDPGCVGCDTIGCDGGCGASCCGEFCDGNAWRPCLTLCMPQDGWASFEFLGWWQDGMQLPPLVTTNLSSTPAPGVLGDPGTRILAGGEAYHDEALDGGRFRFGLWLDSCHTWGVGAEYFSLSSSNDLFSASSTGNPVLTRPFYDVVGGFENAQLIAFPDVIDGSVTVHTDSDLVGGGFRFRKLRQAEEGCSNWFLCGCPEHFCSRTELTFGYRFLQLTEGVRISENLTVDSANVTDPAGTFDLYDSFKTKNQFNGFDIGYITRRTRGFWSLETGIRLAVGNTKQTVNIDGQSVINETGQPTLTEPGALLTQTSNIGSYTQNEFAVVPELDLKIGYQMTKQCKLTLGYTAIYWSNVVRPGDQIDLDVHPDLLPPSAPVPFVSNSHPTFAFDTTDYWVQGLSFGGEYRW
ncbi:MAG: BBP7 family outer membrane beta-barrel protein [Rubripirellula sp.]